MRRPAAVATLVATVAVALSLSSCGGIPSSGPVQVSSASAPAPQDQFIRVLARPPRVGATRSEIVAGFLTASGSFENDHAVARTYLTPAAAKRWSPQAHVSVYDANPGYRLTTVGSTSVRMFAEGAAGSISARGSFRQPAPDSSLTVDFSLQRIAGQWRIAGPPRGLLLSTADVTRAYRTVNLYFLDVAGGVLVPDPLFLPAQQPGAATVLTRELFAGPTPWLAPAVRTAVPPGTRLAVDSVPVQQGIARVDLSPTVLGPDAAATVDLRGFAAQITYTLAQLPDVSGVRLTVNGVPFVVPGIGAVSRVSDWPTFNPAATPTDSSTYALEAGHLATIATSAQAVPGFFGRATTMTAGAAALDGALVAGALRERGASVVRVGAAGAARAPVVYRGTDVRAVSFDRLNSVWIADRRTSGSSVWLARPGRAAKRVRVEGAALGSIRALRVSRDGARIAMVVVPPGGEGAVLLVGRVERASGVAAVSGLRRVESTLTDVLDVSWSNDTDLLTVAKIGVEPFQAYTVGIDGDSVLAAGLVPSMVTVASCPGRPFLAGTTGSTLFLDDGSGWRPYVTADVPIYPG